VEESKGIKKSTKIYFCIFKYGVKFPLTTKVSILGRTYIPFTDLVKSNKINSKLDNDTNGTSKFHS
jgi:glutathione peroxidase-family protein